MKIDSIQNFQTFKNFRSDNKNPYMHSAGSATVAGQLGLIRAQKTFGTYNPEKINESEKTQTLTKTEVSRPKFLELISGLGEVNIVSPQSAVESVSRNTANPYLSNFRGEIGQNMPLGSAAIYENGGFSGAKLNVIA